MIYNCRLVYFGFLVLVLRAGCQERITIYSTSGKNEIVHEKVIKTKTGKLSNKPMIKDHQDESTAVSVTKNLQDESTAVSVTKNLQEESTVVSIIKNREVKQENATAISKEKDIITEKPPAFICPPKNAPRPLFSLPCSTTRNCGFLGRGMLCCDYRCIKGVKPPKTEPIHEPLFFGIYQRKCPVDPLPELSEIKECIFDEDCSSPRICCAEKLQNGERKRYCRTPIPVWDTLPLPSPVLEPLKTMTSYMQCTPPPPPHLDLHPKTCQNPMDCFPNLCCQEKGKKFCRPPKRSLLALVAELGQRIIPEDTARKFIERIS